jgi:hypothetical protein
MELKIIMFNDISQTEKDKYCFSLVYSESNLDQIKKKRKEKGFFQGRD